MPGSGPERSRRNFLAGLAGVAIVGVSTAGAIVFNRDDTATAGSVPAVAAAPAPSSATGSVASTSSAASATGSSSSAEPARSATTSTPAKVAAASTYKDGKYTETGDYDSPAGSETVTVTVTLAADIVTATSATGSATSGPSSQYQEQFISGYSAEVVGKDIDSVTLSRVSGSSLTSNGFNAALTKIKSDAKA